MTAQINNNGGSQFDIIIGGIVVASIGAEGLIRGGPYVPVRQTVLGAPVDVNGLIAPGGATGSASVVTTAITSSAPFVATAANGFGLMGARNVTGQSSTNLTFGPYATNGTMFGYVDIAAGALTTGTGVLPPIYQQGGVPSVTAGQFTFNIGEMKGYVGNGSAAIQTNRVYVNEVTVAGGVVTAIIWYALRGMYRTRFNVAASTSYAKNHNIGVEPLDMRLLGFGTYGSYSPVIFEYTGAYNGVSIVDVTRTSTTMRSQPGLAQVMPSSDGLAGTIAEVILIAERGW